MHYLKGWFLLDMLSSLPIDSIIMAASGDQEAGGSTLRLIKMVRLIKLVRILRASRILSRWEAFIGLSFAYMEIIQFVTITLIMSHWLACLWAFVGRAPSDYDQALDKTPSFLARYGNNTQYVYTPDYLNHNWLQKHGLTDATPTQIYIVSLHVSLANIFGGPSDITPASYLEITVQSVMMLTGSIVWAWVISGACGIVATLNPQAVQYRQTMDELNYFARDKRMPKALTIKLRTYFQNTQHIIFAQRYAALMDKMSPLLRGETALNMAGNSISNLPYFVGLPEGAVEQEFLASTAISMSVAMYSLREYIPVEDLTLVERGIAAKEGRLMTKGAYAGSDMILNMSYLRDKQPLIALTVIVQVLVLERSVLLELLEQYPRALQRVSKAAFVIAFQRVVKGVAEQFAIAQSSNIHMTVQRAVANTHASFKERTAESDLMNTGTTMVQPLSKVQQVGRESTPSSPDFRDSSTYAGSAPTSPQKMEAGQGAGRLRRLLSMSKLAGLEVGKREEARSQEVAALRQEIDDMRADFDQKLNLLLERTAAAPSLPQIRQKSASLRRAATRSGMTEAPPRQVPVHAPSRAQLDSCMASFAASSAVSAVPRSSRAETESPASDAAPSAANGSSVSFKLPQRSHRGDDDSMMA